MAAMSVVIVVAVAATVVIVRTRRCLHVICTWCAQQILILPKNSTRNGVNRKNNETIESSRTNGIFIRKIVTINFFLFKAKIISEFWIVFFSHLGFKLIAIPLSSSFNANFIFFRFIIKSSKNYRNRISNSSSFIFSEWLITTF